MTLKNPVNHIESSILRALGNVVICSSANVLQYGGLLGLYTQKLCELNSYSLNQLFLFSYAPKTFLESINLIEELCGYGYIESSNEVADNVPPIKPKQSFSARSLLRQLKYRLIKSSSFNNRFLKEPQLIVYPKLWRDSLIHIYAYCANDRPTTGNLSANILSNVEYSPSLRSEFSRHLEDCTLEKNLIHYIVHTFPIAFLEGINFLVKRSNSLSSCIPSNVFTSIYGFAADPVLHLCAHNAKSQLNYVQHGGGYALCGFKHAYHESRSCNRMIYWGLGDYNVYPCMIPSEEMAIVRSSPLDRPIAIVLSTDRSIKFVTTIINILKSFCGVNFALCIHPRSKLTTTEILDIGLPNAISVVRGVALDDILYAKLVVFDSVMHTLLYWKVCSKTPFVVLDDQSSLSSLSKCQPIHENGSRFVSLLKDSLASCHLLDLPMYIKSSLESNFRNKFCCSTEALAELIVNNPNLYDIAL